MWLFCFSLSLFNRSAVSTVTLTTGQTNVKSHLRVLLSLLTNKDAIQIHHLNLNLQQPNAVYPPVSMKPSVSPAFLQIQNVQQHSTKMSMIITLGYMSIVPKKPKQVLVKKTTKPKSCKNIESCTYKASPSVSCGSTAKEPKSLWFGLDLSEINQT